MQATKKKDAKIQYDIVWGFSEAGFRHPSRLSPSLRRFEKTKKVTGRWKRKSIESWAYHWITLPGCWCWAITTRCNRQSEQSTNTGGDLTLCGQRSTNPMVNMPRLDIPGVDSMKTQAAKKGCSRPRTANSFLIWVRVSGTLPGCRLKFVHAIPLRRLSSSLYGALSTMFFRRGEKID